MNLLNLFRSQTSKATPASIDKETVPWGLSWLPEGRCDSFNKEAILLFAPPTAGVYGLFNFDCQVFIGQGPNIQEALLRHESETDFLSQHLRPTGFTFEPCAAELCKTKADELIARFRPVLQTEAALTETSSRPSNDPMNDRKLGDAELRSYPDRQEFPRHEREKQAKGRRYFYFKWTHGAFLAALLVAGVMVIFHFGLPASKNIHKQVKPLPRITISQPLASGRPKTNLRAQSVFSIDTAAANQSSQPTPGKPDVQILAASPNGTVRFPAESASAAKEGGIQAPSTMTGPIAHPTGGDSSKRWSVQVSAETAESIADTLVQRLKASGYEGYVVRVQVKGQTYYRVRVGHFEAREEAESVRKLLMRQDGYLDAYLTND